MIAKTRFPFAALLLCATIMLDAQNPVMIWRAQSAAQQAAPPPPAPGTAATVQSSNPIQINGTSTGNQGNSTIFVGDKIETAKGAAAVITAEGSTVLVPAGSTMIFGDNDVQVGCGGAVISTVRGMSARVVDQNLAVFPVDSYAKFEMNTAHGDLQIAVREGSVNVLQGPASTLTQASKTLQTTGKLLVGFKNTFLPAGSSLIVPNAGCLVAPAVNTAATGSAAAAGQVAATVAVNRSTKGPVTPVVP